MTNKATLDIILAMFTLQMHAADYHGTEGMVDSAAGTTTSYPEDGSEGLSPEMKEYYTERLIRKQGPKLVHEQFGVSRPIPANKGDRVEFRYRKALPKATKPIIEGVTPDPSKMTVVARYADVEQYGSWLGYTDKLKLTSIDPMVTEMTVSLSEQSGLTCDTVVREVINGGTNVRYAPRNAGTQNETKIYDRAKIDNTCLMTVKDIFKMATVLTTVNAPTIDGMYVAIAHPHVIFDIMMGAPDKTWQDVMSYAKPENILKGEVGSIGGVRFVKTSEAKIFKGKIADKYDYFTVKAVNAAVLTVEESFSEAEAEEIALIDKYVVIGEKRYEIESANHTDKTLTLKEAPAGAAAGTKIYAGNTGANGGAVYSTLFLAAKDAYGVVDLGGKEIEFIAKPLGASGEDQLNQRGSVGWKTWKGAVILHDEYLLRYESSSSMADEVHQGN